MSRLTPEDEWSEEEDEKKGEEEKKEEGRGEGGGEKGGRGGRGGREEGAVGKCLLVLRERRKVGKGIWEKGNAS